MDIVEAEKGSGVVILSVDNAARYLQQLTGVETMTSLRQSIRQDLDNQLLLAQQLQEKMSDLMDRAERFQHLNPFNPFEITVEVGSICEGKTLADVNFWQNTMATGHRHFPQWGTADLTRTAQPDAGRGHCLLCGR